MHPLHPRSRFPRAEMVITYHLRLDGTGYQDLGGNYWHERDHQATPRRSLRRLEGLAYKVTVEAA